jgi:1-acyl-sn-glycerol-3-phosphate acyltransferase
MTERLTKDLPTREDIERPMLKGLRLKMILNGVRLPMTLLARVNQVGLERVPRKGPLLYVSNHLHFFDPFIEYFVFPRRIHFMGKKEVFENPAFRTLALWSGGFPVDRGKMDRTALRNAEARLNHGYVVGIYPEGSRSDTGALEAAKEGAGLLALRSGAPVLPVAITGSERLPFNGSTGRMQAEHGARDPEHKGVRILYGEPFVIPREVDGKRVSIPEATTAMMLEVARLLPADYRGVYADRLENEEKRLAQPYRRGVIQE